MIRYSTLQGKAPLGTLKCKHVQLLFDFLSLVLQRTVSIVQASRELVRVCPNGIIPIFYVAIISEFEFDVASLNPTGNHLSAWVCIEGTSPILRDDVGLKGEMVSAPTTTASRHSLHQASQQLQLLTKYKPSICREILTLARCFEPMKPDVLLIRERADVIVPCSLCTRFRATDPLSTINSAWIGVSWLLLVSMLLWWLFWMFVEDEVEQNAHALCNI